MTQELHRTLLQAGDDQGWWHAPGLLVAVSGGSDSMALLHLLRLFYPGRLAVGHLEHGFRGAASLADAAFVAEYCRQAGILCFVRHGDVLRNRRRGESDEMAGRRVRYEFFDELLRREGLPFVATGHTADDVVETLLYNLFRGTGPAGLSGIAGRRGTVVRPLLSCRRRELRAFLAESGVAWREDETNADDRYRRNKIRNRLLPWVRTNLNASADRALLGLAGECRAWSERQRSDARARLPWLSRSHPFALASWETAVVRCLSPEDLAQALREQARALSLPVLDRGRLDELVALIRSRSGWRFQWAGDVEVCGARSRIGWLRRRDLSPPPEAVVALHDGEAKTVAWGGWTISVSLRARSDRFRRGNAGWSAALPAASPSVRIRVRPASDAAKGELPRGEMAWWERAAWPTICWSEGMDGPIDAAGGVETAELAENFCGSWRPGALNSMQDESSYVIIARVFATNEKD